MYFQFSNLAIWNVKTKLETEFFSVEFTFPFKLSSLKFVKYRVALIFAGILILRIGYFLRLEETGFCCWELIFAIFRKSPSIWNYNVVVF